MTRLKADMNLLGAVCDDDDDGWSDQSRNKQAELKHRVYQFEAQLSRLVVQDG